MISFFNPSDGHILRSAVMTTELNRFWKILLAWYAIYAVGMSLSHNWTVLAFSLTFGVGYGGGVYIMRRRIRSVFLRIKTGRFPVFIFISLAISAAEEYYVHILGNRTALANIWLDMIIVPITWIAWMSTWYLFLSRRYGYTEEEILLLSGSTGILFEYVGTGSFLTNPLGFVLSIPATIIVYAAIFILPMQMISFNGINRSWTRYPVSSILPYVLSLPVSLLLYAILL